MSNNDNLIPAPRAELPRVFVTWKAVMQGAADVLHESSKQHWANGDKAHSLMCDEQVDELIAAIAALTDQQGGG